MGSLNHSSYTSLEKIYYTVQIFCQLPYLLAARLCFIVNKRENKNRQNPGGEYLCQLQGGAKVEPMSVSPGEVSVTVLQSHFFLDGSDQEWNIKDAGFHGTWV